MSCRISHSRVSLRGWRPLMNCSTMSGAKRASRNTLKQHFRDLTERKHLERHGSGRGVWYGLN